ncbi:MAG: D-2-hydroxyacid dehydrogenase [Christensenellaceae bacterium]|jgi:glycerate dehydrogenase|nr:D-2-hydroxyacid dehydrogenase [Christensenellaceae bacterium]
MKVVVFQQEAIGGEPRREELIAEWKRRFAAVPGVDELVFHNPPGMEGIDELIGDADALLGMWIRDHAISEEFLGRHPKLKYIATLGHGFGAIDNDLTRARGLTVTNTIYGDWTIAQYAIALLLDLCHNIAGQDDFYRNKVWSLPPQEAGRPPMRVVSRQIELYEKTFGVWGLGSIGLRAAQMAVGLGMKVIGCSRTKKQGPQWDFIEQVPLNELLLRSDVISLHVPLSKESAGIVNKESIARMKDGVILINTARGALIDENDLIEALKSGKVYAAGLDVLAGEPLKAPAPIMALPNTRITQHIAWAPAEARLRTIRVAVENFKNWLEGHPTSVVN